MMTAPADSAIQPDPMPPQPAGLRKPGWDTYFLMLLTLAHLQIAGLAEAAALPTRVQDVLRHPLLGRLLPPAGFTAMGEIGPRPGDPIGLILNALTLGALFLYCLADLALTGRWRERIKWIFLACILTTALFLPTAKLILLRQGSGPASYAHDGGVIQTEVTIRYTLEGRNPYVEDYTETPMAEWGFSQYRTALYHYPYLPWTFLFSAPFYLAANAIAFYDQRFVYIVLVVLALTLAPRLTRGARPRLALVAALGLNPILALDLMFGQNDPFVLCWIVFSLVSWRYWRDGEKTDHSRRSFLWISALLFGLACASKPTAWFLAPFYGLLMVADQRDLTRSGWRGLVRAMPILFSRIWPALAIFIVIVGPYLLWEPWSFYDDLWRWSSGQGETGYQIWGWGGSNFVLGLGWVENRFDQWPFWLTEILVAVPLLIWFVRRQQQENTLANACWHSGLLLFGFFYVSRFLNENYLGFLLALMSIALFNMLSDQRHTSNPSLSGAEPTDQCVVQRSRPETRRPPESR